jgi:hypothetical protein
MVLFQRARLFFFDNHQFFIIDFDSKEPKVGGLAEMLLRRLKSFLRLDVGSSRTLYWRVKKSLRLDFLEDLNEMYWREYPVNDLKRFYSDNLEWVLKTVGGNRRGI